MSEKSIVENEEIRRNSPSIDRRSYLKTIGATGGGLAFGGLSLGETSVETARAAPTVLDDFEDGDIDEYTGHTANYAVEQSSGLEGNYRLKCSDPYDQLASTSTHGRGYRYEYRFIAGSGSGSKPGLLTCIQDGSNPVDSCYWLHTDVPNDNLVLFLRENGSSDRLDKVYVSSGLSEATEYRGVLELRSDTVKGILYDSSGNQLASTSEITDTTHSDGHYGFYTGAGQPAYYDYVTKEDLGGSSSPDSFVIDNFEDGGLSEYEHDPTRDGEATIVSSPTYNGSAALEIEGENAELISTSGLDAYPEAGDTFSFWVRSSGGGDNLNVTWGVQDHENRYLAKVKAETGSFYLFTTKGGDSTQHDYESGLSIAQDTWYEVEIDWATDGTQTVILYDSSGSQLSQISMTDTTWTSGGVGYDAYPSSGESAYFDYVTLEGSKKSSPSYRLTVDDFEDGNLSEYTKDGRDEPEIVSSPTYNGSYAVKLSYSGEGNLRIDSTDGLSRYPVAGDTFSYWVNLGYWNRFRYGVQDGGAGYEVNIMIDGDNSLFEISRGANSISLITFDASILPDEWLELEVQWGSNGRHTATLYDDSGRQLLQTSGSDSKFTSGGIGYICEEGTVYVDSVGITHTEALGSFENDADGWSCSDDHQHERIHRSQIPTGVTYDNHGMAVEGIGTTHPRITNTERCKCADFASNPHLYTDIVPRFNNSDSDVEAKFRLHRSDTDTVEEGPTVTVPQNHRSRVYWDTSELSTEALDNAEKLELVWYPSDQPPSTGDGSFDYDGFALIGDIRLNPSPSTCEGIACRNTVRNLELTHGKIVEFKPESRTASTEDGQVEFDDGTTKDYTFEIVGEEQYEYTIDGITFRTGGGW
jgi:hypothetical protein